MHTLYMCLRVHVQHVCISFYISAVQLHICKPWLVCPAEMSIFMALPAGFAALFSHFTQVWQIARNPQRWRSAPGGDREDGRQTNHMWRFDGGDRMEMAAHSHEADEPAAQFPAEAPAAAAATPRSEENSENAKTFRRRPHDSSLYACS